MSVSNKIALGWVVHIRKPDGTVRYRGSDGKQRAKIEAVKPWPDKRKALRLADRLSNKHPGWLISAARAYTDPDPAESAGGWTPFKRVEMDREPDVDEGLRNDPAMYVNNLFTVIVDFVPVPEAPNGRMIHLSIRHNNRCAAHDWRAFQRIKNELLGPEYEAVELYPAESRLLDTANQFHLWAFDNEARFPVGYTGPRNVSGTEEAEDAGAKQRTLLDEET